MKVFIDSIKKIKNNKMVSLIFESVLFWIIMVIVFLYLLNNDASNAPDFIYNQF